MILNLELELLTDVSLSAGNQTLGEPETHQHIPGRTLWGAVASAAYRSHKFSDEEAFRLFHQGAVRVLDAVPLVDGKRAYPTPRSWQKPKASLEPVAYNCVLEKTREQLKGQQYKPLGEGWRLADGQSVEIPKNYTLRSALDASGRAREGILFGISALRAGSRFTTQLIGEAKDVEAVAGLLLKQDLRLGRSRNAELGLVRVSKCSQEPAGLSSGRGKRKSIPFLCVSRCIFHDPLTGAPTFTPLPSQLGLDKNWKLDPTSSFIKTARIVHFNSKRGRPETERFAIERGSVLTFITQADEVDVQPLATSLEMGVGQHCGEGYGQLLVAPTWLTESEFKTFKFTAKDSAKAAEKPTDKLFCWAEKQAQGHKEIIKRLDKVQTLGARLRSFGASSSQWGEIRRMAREARFSGDKPEKLIGRIEKYLDDGKRKLTTPWKKAKSTLLEELRNHQDTSLPTFVELLASACMRPGSDQNEVMEGVK